MNKQIGCMRLSVSHSRQGRKHTIQSLSLLILSICCCDWTHKRLVSVH